MFPVPESDSDPPCYTAFSNNIIDGYSHRNWRTYASEDHFYLAIYKYTH